MTTVDIVIVNWNAGEQLRECVESVLAEPTADGRLGRIIVVDNASTDRSYAGLDTLSNKLVVLRNTENRGFAAACNQGARAGSSDSILFLNPDTRLLGAAALEAPLRCFEADTAGTIGIVGVQLVDEGGAVHRSCARFPSALSMVGRSVAADRVLPKVFPPHFMTDWDHATDRDVDEVMGAFFCVRRRVFDALDGFDERFFVYYEEVDFCLRAASQGFRTRFLASARVFHRGGGTTSRVKALRLFFSLRSRLLFAHKHFGRVGTAAVFTATMAAEPWARVCLAAARGRQDEVTHTLAGYRMLWRAVARGELVR